MIPRPSHCTQHGEIELNAGAPSRSRIDVANTGDRPVQVGSHYHFFETNAGPSSFDRDTARGMRLDIRRRHRRALRARPEARDVCSSCPLRGRREVYGVRPAGDGQALGTGDGGSG
ncbi:MAG: urease subunit beta [Rhizobium sp.]|nr:urease subunit beta [Rhizobium sp.]